MEKEKLHPIRWKITYTVLRVLLGWLLKKISGFHCKKTKIKSETFLLLSNHNNDLDWAFPVIETKRHMRFVASANILEGFAGKIIRFLVGPIPRKKGASAEETTRLIYETLKSGISVAVFPEGNKSWDGKTGFISRKNAEIAKNAGCGLVTYRIEGEYLRSPRWSSEIRKGPVFGSVVSEYSKDDLKEMTTDEIYEAIRRDLYTDASVFAKTHRYRYPGKSLSKHIESVLYICPECKKIGTLKSEEDSFYCSCGLKGRMNEYGLLESLNSRPLPFDNTVDWNSWQREYLLNNRESLSRSDESANQAEPLFSDYGDAFYQTDNDRKELIDRDCRVDFYPDRLEIGEHVFQLSSILRFSVFRNHRLFFTSEDGYYEVTFPEGVSGLKYDALHRVFTEKPYE